VNGFSILLGLGASFGLACVVIQAQNPPERQRLVDAGLVVLLGALIGGRAFYVAGNWAYFQPRLIETFQVWLGGFSAAGALAGGLLALFPAAIQAGFSPAALADRLLPLLPPLAVSAWLACWQAGSAYGPEAAGAWWALPARDEWGAIAPRLPVQLLAALLSLGVFAAVEWFKPRFARPGQAASLGFAGLVLVLLAASLLRVDPVPTWLDRRWDSWTGAGLVLVALFFCLGVFSPKTGRFLGKIKQGLPGS
jgi:prolipoprotein diacylglyceryltransferase